jgi:hypothetical protein
MMDRGPAPAPAPAASAAGPRQIVCVKWGTLFGPEYVNRLWAMARRQVTGPLRLVCLTDDPRGLRPEVEAFELPGLGVEHPKGTRGKWRKVVLWGSQVPGLANGTTALFVDLDSVIVDNIDGYFTHGDPGRVYLARNWAKPLKRLGQTSVFRFPVGANPHILERFRADPQGVADRYRFEQHYITASVAGGIELWPEAWTRHFRLHCLPAFPMRLWQPARLPPGAKIVTFPGGPNPDRVVLGAWNERVPPGRTPWQHLMATFGPASGRAFDSRWRHLTRYVRPVPWIDEHWRE